MSTDGRAIVLFLQHAWRRRALLLSLATARAALGGTLILLGIGWLGLLPLRTAAAVGMACVGGGALLGWWRAHRDRRRIAHHVEARAPHCRNLLVTAAELLAAGDDSDFAGRWAAPRWARQPAARPQIMRLVEARAAELAGRLDAAAIFPLQRVVATLVGGIVLCVALAATVGARPRAVDAPAPVRAVADAAPSIDNVEVVITPPPYTGRGARTVTDPQRLEVIAGSRLEVAVRATAARVELDTLEGALPLERDRQGVFRGGLVAVADGFLALAPSSAAGVGVRRFIGLVVVPDAPPRVRITEPGRDLFLPQAGDPIAVAVSAQDDFGLDDLRLTYTIVSGSGETFEFTEGELPLRLRADGALSWIADAELAPAALGLSLGDMVVYRAQARDARPAGEVVESDAFVVEIVGQNAAIAGGFALESDEEREALSQRMVIVKTERLLQQRDAMSAEDYAAAARRIAAEQRLVRAEFVFMMGGEIQDEVEEAEHEHEVAAGRLELRGRQEMSRSVQFMSRAAARLTDADVEAALPLELQALELLQSALARSRYILRTMAERESIDLLRRLTGEPGAARGALAAPVAQENAQLAQLRRLLAEVAATPVPLNGPANALADLAEAALRIDASAPVLQRAAADLAAAAAGGADAADRREQALQALRRHVNERLPLAPPAAAAEPGLAGILADELSAGGGGR